MTGREPQAGDGIMLDIKMKSGIFTHLGGSILSVSDGYAYFAVDGVESVDDSGDLLDRRDLQGPEAMLLRAGIRCDKLEPFDGGPDEDAPCWLAVI
jgi:hypothetical protein